MQRGILHRQLLQLHDRYGPVVRIAPDELAYNDTRAWKDIYSNRAIEKNRIWAGQEEEERPVSVVSCDEAVSSAMALVATEHVLTIALLQTHLKNRRALTAAFTDHAIAEQHGPVIESLVDLMITKFKDAISASNGQDEAIVNMVDWFDFLIFDISGALSFGESFDSVKIGKAHPWVEISRSFGKGIALRASINFFRPLDKLMKFAMPKNILEKMQYHKDLVHEKLGQRLATDRITSTRHDYVGSILEYNEEKGEVRIPTDEIEANMTVLIFAGSETTSTAMAGILNQLFRHPPVLRKLEEEIRDAFEREEDVTIASTSKLDYLHAVINEGLRMNPPPSIGLPRQTPKDGAIICDQYVPGGTFVEVNQFATFRSPSNFTQPDSFIPERFLRNSPFPNDNLHAFEPFLVGRHKCLGMKLALAEMRSAISRLLFTFDVEAVDDVKDFGEQKTFIFWEKDELKVRLRLR